MSTPDFAINGRFLGQNATGVQRYAANIAHAMNEVLAAKSLSGTLVAPSSTPDPALARLPLIGSGPLAGHLWEQFTLPTLWKGPLINLSNTAPAFKRNQIVCIHDANVFTAPDSYSRSFRALYRTLQPHLARGAARISTVSHASARQIARHLPIRVEDIVVLPNGHEHALAWNPARAERAAAFVGETYGRSDRRFVLVLGSRARHKNLRLVEQIAPELDAIGIDVVAAGSSVGIFTDGAIGRQSNLKLLGRVTDDDLAYLFDHALCLVFPSLTEGFGLPIVEAMARHCPVIASNCASMPEVCGPAALLAPPTDPAAWIDHIRTLARSPALAADLVGRGDEWVRRFSWTSTASAYLDLVEHPTAHHAAQAPFTPVMPKVTVAVATRGRPEIVATAVRHLIATQTLQPEAVILSCVAPSDAGDLVDCPEVTIVTGPPGLAAQRNTALRHLPAASDIVAFFDDDFVADKDWLLAAARIFRDEAQVVGFTGRVVADGIKGPGIPHDEAVRLVETASASSWNWIEPFSPYGCNMAFRVDAIGDTRFDERLVLYGWLEDRDFAAALAKCGGRFVKCAGAFGVHMGTKSGRVSGDRLGYSQIANPLYMLRKGTMTTSEVAGQIFRNLASNFGLYLTPEPFIDRRGRAWGNLLALAHMLGGRLMPEWAATIRLANRSENIQQKARTR